MTKKLKLPAIGRIYISGPMTDPATGRPSPANIEAFRQAERLLRYHNIRRTVNPVRVWACRWPWLYRCITAAVGQEWAYRLVLLYDLLMLLRCSHIYKIPGWRQSRGANIESCVAYHFKIWQLPTKAAEHFDKRLAHAMEKYTESDTKTE